MLLTPFVSCDNQENSYVRNDRRATVFRSSQQQLVACNLECPQFNLQSILTQLELLELILTRLSPAQQLSARGVCRGFREVIERSPNMALREFRRRRHTEMVSLPPFNIRGLQLGLTKARGVSGVSVVLDLGVQSKHYKRVLRKSRTLRKTLIARPAPSRARLSADCGCAVSRSWLFETKAGVTFGDVFNAVDALGSHRCETCLSKYYVRVRSAYGGS